MGIKLHFVLFPPKCPLAAEALLVQRNYLPCVGISVSHHNIPNILWFYFCYSTIHWSQLSFFSMTLDSLRNLCDVFIKRRLFLSAEIIHPVARCPNWPHSLTGYCCSHCQVEGALMTPPNPNLTQMNRERFRKPDLCQVFIFVLEYLLQKNLYNVDFVCQMLGHNPDSGTYAHCCSFLPI